MAESPVTPTPCTVVKFERVGRRHDVPDLAVESGDWDVIAEAVHKAVRPYLASRDYAVTVNADTSAGSIEYGRFGRFTIEGAS